MIRFGNFSDFVTIIEGLVLFQVLALGCCIFFYTYSNRQNIVSLCGNLMYMFFVLVTPYLAQNFILMKWQRICCGIIYAILLCGGTALNFATSSLTEFPETKELKYVKLNLNCKKNSVRIKDNEEKFFGNIFFGCYICLLFALDIISIIGSVNRYFINGFLNTVVQILINMPLYLYGAIIAIMFTGVALYRKRDYYKSAIVIFVSGVILYAYIVFACKWNNLVFVVIVLWYSVGCSSWIRTKGKLILRILVSICGAIILFTDINGYIMRTIDEYGDTVNSIEMKFALMVVLVLYLLGVRGHMERNKDKKYVKMFIIDKEQVNKNDNYGDVLGLYCLSWTIRDISYRASEIADIEERCGRNPEELLDSNFYAFAMETSKGWYYCQYNKKFLSWESVEKPWKKERKMLIHLLVMNPCELDMLDERSCFAKMYRKKYNGKYHMPVHLRNRAIE